jgi:hypothetical protein
VQNLTAQKPITKLAQARKWEVSENNVLIKIKIIKYKMTMSTLLLLLITTA